MDPGRALRRWSDTQHNSLCLPHSHCLQSQAQLYSKLGQAATGLHNPQTETALTPSRQRLKGKGRSLCFSHVAPTSRRDNGRAPQQRFKWRYMTRAHSLLLLCSWLNNWILTSHYSCIPCSLDSYTEKPRLPSALFCSQELKKKMQFYPLCKYNTFNFTSFSLQHKEGKDRKSICS